MITDAVAVLLTDEAAAEARQFAFAYHADRQEVQVRAARVYRRDGRVDEIGSPSELAVSGGIYSELLRLTASSSAADRERLKAFGFHVDGADDEDESDADGAGGALTP